MKVLLIQPPISDFYDTRIRTYPLGLLYLANKIMNIADVKVFDLRTGYKPKIKEDSFFDDLKEFYNETKKSPFSLFSKFYYFGMEERQIIKEIAEFNPDLVCISSLFSTYFFDVIDIARKVKKIDKNILVVVGGNHPTIFPEKVLAHKEIDFVIRGEGETPLFLLISSFLKSKKIKESIGICFKENGVLKISPPNIEKDINILPERRLIDSSRYKIGKNKYAFVITTRGCPKNCSFCGKPALTFRKVSLETIEKDLQLCYSLGVKSIDFEDDMLTFDKEHFLSVLDVLSNFNFSLSAMNGIYAENLDEKILNRMFDVGFRRLNISLVDISERILNYQKRYKLTYDLLTTLENSNFFIEIHFIVGLPGQTPEDVINTLLFLMEHRCLPAPSIFYLSPGSKIFNDFPYKDEIDLKALRSSFMFEISKNFSRRKIYTLLLLSRFISFVKSLIDKNEDIKKVSDILDICSIEEKKLLSFLFVNKKFFYINKENGNLCEEPVEKDLIELFFKKAKNKVVKGFKSKKKIIFDL